MGLSGRESGFGAARADLAFKSEGTEGNLRVALAGNPNVGKSTLFNSLTGLNQHTGNWAGKTVRCAEGYAKFKGENITVIDLPGTYSMYATSVEEGLAADYIAFGGATVTLVVCDATSLERSLALALGVIEISRRTVVAVNLLDEAEREGIRIDLEALEKELGVAVVGCVAKDKKSRERVLRAVCEAARSETGRGECRKAPPETEKLAAALAEGKETTPEHRYIARRLLCGVPIGDGAVQYLGYNPECDADISGLVLDIRKQMLTRGALASDETACDAASRGARIAAAVTKREREREGLSRLDRILTGRVSAYPAMLLLLLAVLFITITLANYPSELLSRLFGYIGVGLRSLLLRLGAPPLLISALVGGIYTVLAEVVSVMLPPMAIFFPLFTLLEDSGYLPRVAYNLDRPFRCVGACGKQSLTMCMGLGCNAAGIVGCRIIDSPRERTLAAVTNSLMPCNGRFPTVILLVGLFFSGGGALSSLASAAFLLGVIVLGVGATFLLTFILSRLVYRGEPSFFTIEMPPFRRPDVLRVLARSFLDRTVYVLLRAAAVAAPAGLIIWLLVTLRVGDASLFAKITEFFDPLGRLMGMDGVMLTAFILGFPANELVLPLAVIGYSGVGIGEALGTLGVGEILLSAGWTPLTAVCVIIFSLMHWPCSTALISVWRETRSLKATLLALLCPTLMGFILTALLNLIFG